MFDLLCNWRAGCLHNPLNRQRIGYVTDFDGLGLAAPLAKDLIVTCPHPAPTYSPLAVVNNQVSVPAVIETFSWNGGAGDPIMISFYVSQNNAQLLKSLQQIRLKTTVVRTLGWWIANYDEEEKKWFEECYPASLKTVSGHIITSGSKDVRLQIGTAGTKVAANVDVSLFNVYVEIAPAANQQFSLVIAPSSSRKIVRSWGVAYANSSKVSAATVGT